jgi:carboxypeptidase family protein/TonB-dependent receptor-like protein
MRQNPAMHAAASMCAFSAALVLTFGGAARVDAQAVRATILGTVRDSTGGTLPGVSVEARNVGTGGVQSTVSNEQGRFNLPDLPLGTYEVQASIAGFQRVVHKGLTLAVGSQNVVDFTLPIGQVEETVTVTGESPMVDTTSAAFATTISQKQIADLPLNGRNYAQLITLSPGVTTVQFQGSLFGRQQVYSVAGGRPEGQAFLLDNTNVANFWNRAAGSGVLGTTLGVEAIEEFQTLTNTYSAQFGGGGGAINAITRSGANAFHGSAFEFVRNSRFDARQFFDDPTKPKPPFNRNQYGGSLGGAVKKDRAFFFLNYEGIKQNLGETRIATVPDANARNGLIPIGGVLTSVGVAAAVKPVLDLYPLPTTPLSGGVGQVNQVDTTRGYENYILGRFDYTLSPKTSFFARYVSDTADLTEPFSGSPIPLWPATNKTNNQIFTGEQRRLMSSSVINQVRVGFVRTRELADNTGAVPALTFFPGRMNGTVAPGSGITTVGANQLNPFDILQRKYSVADDMYWNRGAHAIKFGGSFERQETDINAPFQWGGVWTFTSLQTFLLNQPASIVGALPGQDNAYREFRENDITAYIQDDWRAAQKLTLNLGLRYAPTTNAKVTPGITLVNPPQSPAFTPVDTVFATNASLKNFDPRLGVVYDPFADHKTSIRAGFGIFHNVVAPRVYASAYYLNPPYTIGRQDLTVVPPTFPTPFTSVVAALPTQSQGIDYQTSRTPYQEQWNVNVQREVITQTLVTVGYIGSHSNNLFKQRDVNPVTGRTLADGTVVYGVTRGAIAGITPNARVNPSFSVLNTGTSFATSDYHSLQLSVNRRFYRNVQAQVSYALAKCRDLSSGNFGGEGGTASTNPYDPQYDEGPCGFSRTHTFRASAVVALPFSGNRFVEGWQVSGILSRTSGSPFTPAIGFDQSGLGTLIQRPNLAPGRDLDGAVTHNINQWFDPATFALPAPGTLGAVGRNSLVGPDFMTVDLALLKNVKLQGSSSVQLRAEIFNLTNRPNFGQPSVNVFSQTANGGGTINPTAGRITTLAGTARQIQFAVKVIF